MSAYYNEIEPYAAQWLRNLIKEGLIADGEVDTRSIVDVQPLDLRGFTQCHFFAGIGGWSHALRLAGWPDDRPIWTGSCPCQPFSVAGKGAGTDDPRHLWPHFHRLITAVRPPVVMGEQVAGQAGYGWLDGVRADLAREGYASRGVDIPACSVDAPHIRQRLYWVATDLGDANVPHGEGGRVSSRVHSQHAHADCGGAHSHMADAENLRREEWERQDRQQDAGSGSQGRVDAAGTDKGDMADANGYGSLDDKQHSHGRSSKTVAECRGRISSDHMADADQGGRGRRPHDGDGERDGQAGGRDEDHGVAAGGGEDCLDVAHPGNDRARRDVGAIGDGGRSTLDAGAESLRQTHWQGGSGGSDARSFGDGSFWSDHIWLTGADGKSRRSQPGIPLLAHGIPNRVGRLRAYGNAIVPPLAAEVIKAFMETEA